MNKLNKLKILIKPEFNINPEVTANQYAIRCVTITQSIVLFIWILTVVNIFLIDKGVTSTALLLTLVTYVIGAFVCLNIDLSKWWMKYFIITWAVVLITCVTTSLTYHAVIGSILPIIFSSMHSSNKLKYYTVICVI